MSVNLKSLSFKRRSTKNKIPMDRAQEEVLFKLGLETFWNTPFDLAIMLDISAWSLENQPPLVAQYLPRTFLQRLWLLNPQARSPCVQPPPDPPADNPAEKALPGLGEAESAPVNPLDLVTAVYMSSSSFLQQEMTVRMAQCQFAVPLVLPPVGPGLGQLPCVLLWPLRAVVGQWRLHASLSKRLQEGDLASTKMPLVSCVKLGHCSASKSLVLSHLVRGPHGQSEAFLHRGMDGGQAPRKLANGLVELSWVLPSGEPSLDMFPEPMAVANLRGDAATHKKQLSFLCRISSALVVFCGKLCHNERQLLTSWKGMARQLILIDLSDPVDVEEEEIADTGLAHQKLGEGLNLPAGALISGGGDSKDELTEKLREALNNLLPDRLTSMTLDATPSIAEELGMRVDEGVVCRKALALVEEVLRGLEEEGPAQYREQQLTLQGPHWRRLAELEKEESRQKGSGEGISAQLQTEKQNLVKELMGYKMTLAMRIFTDALCSTDKLERAYFLSWMKLRLAAKQRRQHPQLRNEPISGMEKGPREEVVTNGNSWNPDYDDYDSFDTDSFVDVSQNEQGSDLPTKEQLNQEPSDSEQLKSAPQQLSEQLSVNLYDPEGLKPGPEPEPSSLGLEHFLREMGLIFELTHSSPGSGTCNVLRLPSVMADLLLYGVPLELLDGDAANVPIRWLACVLAEFNRRLAPEKVRVRILSALGVQEARNADVFSALFGVNFPQRGRGNCCTKGVYLLALRLPDDLRKEMECDFLLMIDVEGLCTPGLTEYSNTLIHDNEMATFVTGLSDVMVLNLPPDGDGEMKTNLSVVVNALLRSKRSGSIYQLLNQGVGIDTKQQTSMLGHVVQILETEAEDTTTTASPEPKKQPWNINLKNHNQNNRPPCLIGPWQNSCFSAPVDKDYSNAILQLKKNLFMSLAKCSAKSKAQCLSEFPTRLSSVWEAVRGETFAISLENTEVAEAFCLLCMEHSHWEGLLQEHMNSWFSEAQQRVQDCKASVLEHGEEVDLLEELKEEARSEVKSQVDNIRSRLDEYLKKDNLHRTYIDKYKANFNMDLLQEQVMNEMIKRLESVKENHYSTTQLTSFQTVLEAEQEAKLHSLVEKCKLNNSLLEDKQLEEEFEVIWTTSLSTIEFRPSDKEDITSRVTELLRANLTSKGLTKHMKKLEVIGKEKPEAFIVHDEHFGYRSRLKHMFEDNNKLQRLEANRLAGKIIKEYNGFVAEKSVLFADFSDKYITEVLQNTDRALGATVMEIRSAFEVDLKVYLCSHACHDFQEIHNHYSKDRNLLGYLESRKDQYLGEFIYQFRKRDQSQRVARAFTSMVFKPAALNYIYRPLGGRILEEMIRGYDGQQYLSPQAFNLQILEELLEEDYFENFLECLLSYESFILKRLQARVVDHLSQSPILEEWRQQRLGEVVGKMAAAVCQTLGEGTNGVLSDTKLLLEKMCLTLEADGEVEVSQDALQGPLFHITTNWEHFVTGLLAALAELRLSLSQEFSQTPQADQVLQVLPVQPQHTLLHQVRGCQRQCPFCRAPCEVGGSEHEIHQALLHRPKGLLSYTCHESLSLSHSTCSCDMARDNLFMNGDTKGQSLLYKEYRSLYPDWSITPEREHGRHTPNPNTYWRYVMVRFNSRFAEEYQREPAQLPRDWETISQEEALQSLREAFHTKQL